MKKRIYKVKSDVYRPDGTKEVHFCGRFNTENETTEGILRKLKWAEQKSGDFSPLFF